MEDGPDFTYDEKTVLASGGYGNVHKGNLKDRTNTPVVVKVPKTKAASISIEEEYAILRKLRRTPGIVHLHSMRKTNEMCTIALELANGSVRGLLRQHKGGLSLEIMKCLVGDMKMGLRELVAHNILHRDIKPDNILYFQRSESDYSFKLSDFGTSKAVASMDETAATICGTAVYMTPQLLGYYIGVEGCTKPKGNQCDSWSTGVTLYECATGDTPFGSMGLLTLYRVVQGIKSRTDAIAYRNKEYQTKLSGPKFEDEKWRELEKLISSLLQQRTAKASFATLTRLSVFKLSDFLPLMAVFADRHAEEAEEDDNNNDMRMSYTPVVGIDLGTTFSVAGIVLPNGKYEIISNQSKTGRLTPSCVAFAGRRVLVGEDALEQRPDNYLNTISQVKRCMGRTEQEISKLQVHNHIQSDASGSPEFRVQYEGNEVTFSPQEISAMILRHMKILAESALADATGISDLKIADAVITVPASFNNDQRKATRDAANIAGLNVLQLLNEPTAAAIAYGLRDGKPRKILVYDLGGGTFDVSIIEMNALNAKVIVTMGEQHLGGEDFDQALLSSLIGEATQRNNMQNMFTMLATCERLKRDLTAKESVSITLPDNSRIVVTRASFTELIEHRLQQTITMVEEAMAAAKLKQADIDDVVLAGGSTRIPRVSELLAEKFGRSKLRRDIDADEAIGMGAIVLANALRGKSAAPSVKLSDVIPKALGSAVRGPSNSLVFSEFIRAFTPIPCSKERSGYTNSKDRQTEIRVPVYEDNCNKSENKIGQLSVPIAPRKADENKIAIKFCVDHNGILTVTATDLETNLAKSIKLDSGALTIDRVDAMRAVAEQMVRKDAQEDNMQMLRAKIEKRLRDVKRMAKQPHELAVLLEQQSAFKRACAEGADVNERDLEILCGNLDKLKANWHSVADIKEVA